MLVLVLLMILLFTASGLAAFYAVKANVKSTGFLRQDTMGFYGADGGAISVLGYMTTYKTTAVPSEVKHTNAFDVTISVLGDSVRYPPGFSVLWKGSDVLQNSVSSDGKAEVEVVAFIPVAPAGYGNE